MSSRPSSRLPVVRPATRFPAPASRIVAAGTPTAAKALLAKSCAVPGSGQVSTSKEQVSKIPALANAYRTTAKVLPTPPQAMPKVSPAVPARGLNRSSSIPKPGPKKAVFASGMGRSSSVPRPASKVVIARDGPSNSTTKPASKIAVPARGGDRSGSIPKPGSKVAVPGVGSNRNSCSTLKPVSKIAVPAGGSDPASSIPKPALKRATPSALPKSLPMGKQGGRPALVVANAASTRDKVPVLQAAAVKPKVESTVPTLRSCLKRGSAKPRAGAKQTKSVKCGKSVRWIEEIEEPILSEKTIEDDWLSPKADFWWSWEHFQDNNALYKEFIEGGGTYHGKIGRYSGYRGKHPGPLPSTFKKRSCWGPQYFPFEGNRYHENGKLMGEEEELEILSEQEGNSREALDSPGPDGDFEWDAETF